MTELLPEIKQAIEFVAAAATGGLIGNRVDGWFVNLYYHEKQRILSWIRSWTLTESDKEAINNDEKLKILFSQVTSSVANEIFDQKLLIWPTITESLLRNNAFSFDKKQYFISLFLKLDPFTIHFLATLCFKGHIEYEEVFPGHRENKKPSITDKAFSFYLGQLQSAFAGTTDLFYDDKKQIHYIKISDLGSQFIDFISNSSQEKIKEIAGQ